MGTSLERNVTPDGYDLSEFIYVGVAATEQTQFDGNVGFCDMMQFDLDSSDEQTEYFSGGACSYYHAAIVQHSSDDTWWVYLEWGRVNNELYSWVNDAFQLEETSDFMFRLCDSKTEAIKHFQKKCNEKNSKRIVQKNVGGLDIWVPKSVKRGYLVQELAQRMRGLPNAYTRIARQNLSGLNSNDPVLSFANDMSGGSIQYAQNLMTQSGAIPTLESIRHVREDILPAAMRIINQITPPPKTKRTPTQQDKALKKQQQNSELIELSEYAATYIPRPLPLGLSPAERKELIVLSEDKFRHIQHDLDIFETLLKNPQQDATDQPLTSESLLGADLEWIDPDSELWQWVHTTLNDMTNNRHFRGGLEIHNLFAVSRPTLDQQFKASVTRVAKKRKGTFCAEATLQPIERPDMNEYNGEDQKANVFLGIHGTRAVNVLPIIQNNLQLPQFIQGVHMTGVDFGYGIYFATDWKKSYGYVGADDSYYRKSGYEGRVDNRKLFLILCDVIMGDPYQATGTGSWTQPPQNKDSIVMFPHNISTLGNDEYTIFDVNYQRIRYIVEFTRDR